MRLKDKVARVTGASHGIGRGIALRSAQEGARVAVNYFNGEQNVADVVRLIREGGGGRIINITPVHQELRAWTWDSIYGSMKAAIRRLTVSQERELVPHRITANAIAPGFIDVRLYPGDRYNEIINEKMLLGRGLPEDIAAAAVYIAPDESRYMTGTCILVDGGMLIPEETDI